MPSRRQFLASAGTAAAVGSLAGCLSRLGFTKTGHLQEKALALEWEYDGTTYRDEPLDLRFDREKREILGEYDPDFVDDSVRRPDVISVGEAVHDRLSARFEVDYLVGVCGTDFADDGNSYGCLNAWTDRNDFNRVQLNDRTDVRESNHRFDVVSVDEDAYTVESTDVRTFDFAARHEDDGVNSDEW